jgi:hypothetical protein
MIHLSISKIWEVLTMGNQKNHEGKPFTTPWAKSKHAHSQINGETQQSQDLIILKRQTRKQA